MAIEMMFVRNLADRTDDDIPRVSGKHPVTGEKTLLNAETGAVAPWPSAGMCFASKYGRPAEPPTHTKVSMQWAQKAEAEGWAKLINPRPIHRPGGPADDPWRVTHTFIHADALEFYMVDPKNEFESRTYRFTVIGQPDKREDPNQPGSGVMIVEWTYELELVGGAV